jgi:hypothetical protein
VLATGARAQWMTSAGTEFQVNSYTTYYQRFPSVASDSDGDFVVVWQSSNHQDGSGTGVFGQRFTSAGVRRGAEFQVNTYVPGKQEHPAVATDADGDFVVVWHSSLGHDGNAYGIFARRYASSGAAIGDEFQVNTTTTGTQSYPAIAMDSSGRFAVVWHSQDTNAYGIFAQLFDANGTRRGAEFQCNLTNGGNQVLPAVGVNDAGRMVVVWQDSIHDGSGYGIFGSLFNSLGQALSQDVAINDATVNDQHSATVGVADDGRFVVAWAGENSFGNATGIYARRFNDYGGYFEQRVNDFTAGAQSSPSIAVEGDGDFVVAWSSALEDGFEEGVFARRFPATGLQPDFQINVRTISSQQRPAVALADNGAMVVAWESWLHQDGSYTGIFGRRGALVANFDIDGDRQLTPLTDGLLLIRRLFGFSGATLVSNAVGAGCTRCTAGAIAAHIDLLTSATGSVDIDDDGVNLPLTDGLLALRYLFGFRGDALVNGAVSPNCDNCFAPGIESHIASQSQ